MPNFELGMISEIEHPEISKTRSFLIGIGGTTAVFGILALILPISTKFASLPLLGWLLILTGILQIAFSFSSGRWSGFVIHLLFGMFYLFGGLIFAFAPLVNPVMIKITLGLIFSGVGVFRTLLALTVRFETWRWALLSGILALALALYCFVSYRESSVRLIGTLIAIDLIFFSSYLLAFVFSLGHQQPETRVQRQPARA